MTIWLAIDDAAVQNGCVHIPPVSHRSLMPLGRIDEIVSQHTPVSLELKTGGATLFHNWTFHRAQATAATNRGRR